MSEFYWQPSFGTGGSSSSGEPAPKEKSLLEKSLEGVQAQADSILAKALELAKTGNVQNKDLIEDHLSAYQQLTSIIPDSFDRQKVEDVRNQFKYSVLVDKFQKRLKRRIFG
jgi:hypothetical protein